MYLQNRGISVVEKSNATKSGMPRSMLLKRPRFVIDTKLESKIDEYYREIVRPKMLLIDSEETALN